MGLGSPLVRFRPGGSTAGPDSSSADRWLYLNAVAGTCLFFEFVVGAGAFFSPGWASGGAFGLGFHAFLSATLTVWVALLLMTAAAFAGAVVGYWCILRDMGTRRVLRAYLWWLWIAGVAVACVNIWIFSNMYRWVWETFPDGYDSQPRRVDTRRGPSRREDRGLTPPARLGTQLPGQTLGAAGRVQ
jgi:hypothetical protein